LNYIWRPIVDIEINKVSIFVEAEALTRSNRSSTFSLGEAENLINVSLLAANFAKMLQTKKNN